MIYIIGYQVKDSWTIKIGVAKNVERRIRQLQTGCPHRLSILRTMVAVDTRRTEKGLHRYLRHYQTQGEWFNVDGPTLKLLYEVCDRLSNLNL